MKTVPCRCHIRVPSEGDEAATASCTTIANARPGELDRGLAAQLLYFGYLGIR